MNRAQLEHLIRAAGDVSGSRRLILLSKYFAGRDKDNEFCKAVAGAGLADQLLLGERLTGMPINAADAERIRRRIAADFSS